MCLDENSDDLNFYTVNGYVIATPGSNFMEIVDIVLGLRCCFSWSSFWSNWWGRRNTTRGFQIFENLKTNALHKTIAPEFTKIQEEDQIGSNGSRVFQAHPFLFRIFCRRSCVGEEVLTGPEVDPQCDLVRCAQVSSLCHYHLPRDEIRLRQQKVDPVCWGQKVSSPKGRRKSLTVEQPWVLKGKVVRYNMRYQYTKFDDRPTFNFLAKSFKNV